MMPKNDQLSSFGQIALARKFVTMEDIVQALELQQEYEQGDGDIPRLGEALALLGKMTSEEVKEVLVAQHSMEGEQPDINKVGENYDTSEALASEESDPALRHKQGENFANYELKTLIAGNTLGSTWFAQTISNQKPVLLRIFSEEAMHGDSDFVRLFERLVIKATRLEHKNIQNLIRGGIQDGQCYYVCEFCEGRSLRAIIEEDSSLDTSEALFLVSEIANALQYGHSKKIYHNHLSPSSILVLSDNTIKLASYGMVPDPVGNARLMVKDIGRMAFYVAPELITAKGDVAVVGPQSDFFSLGAVLFHSLVGLPAFYATDVEDVLPLMNDVAETSEMLQEAEVPEDVSKFIMTLLATDPADRFKDAAELIKALDVLLEAYPLIEQTLVEPEKEKKKAKTKKSKGDKKSKVSYRPHRRGRKNDAKSNVKTKVMRGDKSGAEKTDAEDKKPSKPKKAKASKPVKPKKPRKPIPWDKVALVLIASLAVIVVAGLVVYSMRGLNKDRLESVDERRSIKVQNNIALKREIEARANAVAEEMLKTPAQRQAEKEAREAQEAKLAEEQKLKAQEEAEGVDPQEDEVEPETEEKVEPAKKDTDKE